MRIAEKFEIPQDSLTAIQNGIERDDAIVEMELMGLSQRVINALEESEYGIIYLKDLIDYTLEEIMTIPNIGETAIGKICTILIRYNQLEKMILNEQKYFA